MASWLISALKLLAGAAAFGAGTELVAPGVQQAIESTSGRVRGPVIDVLTGRVIVKRRRRRRALTASDRADIAFIAGLLGPKAGKDFAVIIGAKS